VPPLDERKSTEQLASDPYVIDELNDTVVSIHSLQISQISYIERGKISISCSKIQIQIYNNRRVNLFKFKTSFLFLIEIMGQHD